METTHEKMWSSLEPDSAATGRVERQDRAQVNPQHHGHQSSAKKCGVLELYQHPHHVLQGEDGQVYNDEIPACKTGLACRVHYIFKVTRMVS